MNVLHQRKLKLKNRGVSFVELIVAAAILVLVFGGLFGTFQLLINVVGKSKAEAGALALANEQLEYIRSLSYNDVGTIGGIVSGSIPENSTTSLNSIVYTERVVVNYVDDDADGLLTSDSNGIIQDYKQVKVEYSWDNKGQTETLALTTNIVPQGIETTVGGGSIRVNVFDAEVQPVENAAVHLYNDTTTTTIDTTRLTDATGVALFSGAPVGANYQITVSRTGYSTDQTYSASSTNPNPNPPHVAVLESEVSTMNFSIDETSDLTVQTLAPETTGLFQDLFDTTAQVAALATTTVTGGAVVLESGPQGYAATGTIRSASTTPASFQSWSTVDFSASTSPNARALVQVYRVTGTSTYALVSDTDLPGNSGGFSSGPIDISDLNTVYYDTLALGAILTSASTSTTPELLSWEIEHVVNQPAIGSVPFTLTGSKTIGLSGTSSPVIKYAESFTTDGSGEEVVYNLEWDLYDVTVNSGAYDIAEACANIPYSLAPGVTETLTLTLVSASTNSLRVTVEDISGDPITGAEIDVSRPSYSNTQNSSVCGQAFYSGLTSADDYVVGVSATGYVSETQTDVDVSGATTVTVILSAI